MRTRPLKESDIDKVINIYEKSGYQYPFPDLSSPLYIIRGVVEDDKKNIIAAGFVKLISEAILVMDRDRSLDELSKALNDLILVGQALTLKHGIPDWHVFIEDDKFADLLRKHYGFVSSGKNALYLRIENSSNGKKHL